MAGKRQRSPSPAPYTTELWDIDRPKDYPQNARNWPPSAIQKVADSIRAFGFRQPVVVDSQEVIIIGHLRRAAARTIPLNRIPVHIAADLNPTQVRQLRLLDNRSHEEATWDVQGLAKELTELKGLAGDLSLTGFDTRELDDLLGPREVLDGLLRIGFLYPQQIIWNKQVAALSRADYWYQHEPCWYVRKKNAPWFGVPGDNSTVWDAPSPKAIMGGSKESKKFDHPTQKPVALLERPILNHLEAGGIVYDPFLGSGSTVIAAEMRQRVCYGNEIEPRYVDVIVERWENFTGKQATLAGTNRTFREVKAKRLAMHA